MSTERWHYRLMAAQMRNQPLHVTPEEFNELKQMWPPEPSWHDLLHEGAIGPDIFFGWPVVIDWPVFATQGEL